MPETTFRQTTLGRHLDPTLERTREVVFRSDMGGVRSEFRWPQITQRLREVGLGLAVYGIVRGDSIGLEAGARGELALAGLGAVSVGVAVHSVSRSSGVEEFAGLSAAICGTGPAIVAALRAGCPLVISADSPPAPAGAVRLDLIGARGLAYAAWHPEAYPRMIERVRSADMAAGEVSQIELLAFVEAIRSAATSAARFAPRRWIVGASGSRRLAGFIAAIDDDAVVEAADRGVGLANAIARSAPDVIVVDTVDVRTLIDASAAERERMPWWTTRFRRAMGGRSTVAVVCGSLPRRDEDHLADVGIARVVQVDIEATAGD